MSAKVRITASPYDSGAKRLRMGRGPEAFINGGASRRLARAGLESSVEVLEVRDVFPTEIGTSFDLMRLIAARTRAAVEEGDFPLLLTGNCNGTVGAAAGLSPVRLGLIWFDAHGDLNTPDSSQTGFLDGMGLAMATGRCWRTLLGTVPGHKSLDDRQVILVGARDLDEDEVLLLEHSDLPLIKWESMRSLGPEEALRPCLDGMSGLVDSVYIHVDMDVHDPVTAPANFLKPAGGLTPEEVQEACAGHSRTFSSGRGLGISF